MHRPRVTFGKLDRRLEGLKHHQQPQACVDPRLRGDDVEKGRAGPEKLNVMPAQAGINASLEGAQRPCAR